MIYTPLIIIAVIIAIEIIFDRRMWKKHGNDKKEKKYSRIIVGLFFIIASILHYILYRDLETSAWFFGVLFMGRFAFFDFSLNVSRWKTLPNAWQEKEPKPYYLKFHKFYRKLLATGHPQDIAKAMALDALTKKERIWFAIRRFNAKFFYHGIKPKKWTYDWIFFKFIMPIFELMIKGIAFGSVFYMYLNRF